MWTLGLLTVPRGAWAQISTVPLGQAAQFGLLSQGNLTVDTVRVLGAAGAGGTLTGQVIADGGLFRPATSNAPTLAAALNDLAVARAYCTEVSATALASLNGQTLTGGVYRVTGNVTLTSQAPLVIQADAAQQVIIDITGNLSLAAGAVVLVVGDIPGQQIIWNVGGSVTATNAGGLPGVVLAGGPISLTGPWLQRCALLTSNSLSLTRTRADFAQPGGVFAAPNQLTNACTPTSALPPTGACPNLVYNGGFDLQNRLITTPITPLTASNVCNRVDLLNELDAWGSTNVATPDWRQEANGNRHVSIGASIALFSNIDFYVEYLTQVLSSPLIAGQAYYLEFRSRRQVTSSTDFTVPRLGALFTQADPYQSTTTLLVNPATNQPYQPTAADRDNAFNSTTTWSRTAGCFQATGSEQFLTIGNFAPYASYGSMPPPSSGAAYYNLDNVILRAFPVATTVCESGVYTLRVSCALPTSSQATYSWTTGNNVPVTNTTVQPAQTTTYTLTVTVPSPEAGRPAFTRTSQVTVPGAFVLTSGSACAIQECVPLTVLNGTSYTTAQLGTLQAGRVYRFTNNVTFTGAGTTFNVPANCALAFDAGRTLTLATGVRLQATGALFTAACSGMWGGIVAQTGSQLSLTQTAFNHSEGGIYLANAGVPLTLDRCTFTNNLRALELGAIPFGGSASWPATVASQITGCTFTTSGPFRSSPNGSYTLANVHLNLSNYDLRTWTISGNSFSGAFVGIFGGARLGNLGEDHLRTGMTLLNNSFACAVGGVMVISSYGMMGTVQGNTFQVPLGYPRSATQLTAFQNTYFNTPWNSNWIPAGLTTQPVGIYAYWLGNEITGNTFTSTAALGTTIDALTNTPVGIYGWGTRDGARLLNNTFTQLGGGLVMGVSRGGRVQGNTFTNCRNGLRLRVWDPTTTSDGVTNALWVSCNDFQRTLNVPGTRSAGIYIEPGVKVNFATLNPSGVPNGSLMKNRFIPFTGQAAVGTVWHHYLFSAAANTYLTGYTTFSNASQTNTSSVAPFTSSNIRVDNGGTFAGQTCALDGFPNTGIQNRPSGLYKTADSGSQKMTVWPNPAEQWVTVKLPTDLPSGEAELLIREGRTGLVAQRRMVAPGTREIALPINALAPGLYLLTVQIVGQWAESVRLQIVR